MQSEFASLLDLVIHNGFNHSDLIEEIHATVLDAFKHQYPQAPIGVRLFVDEITGDIRLIVDQSDITPPEFAPIAAGIARTVLIGKLSTTTTNPKTHAQSGSVLSQSSGTTSIFSARFKSYFANIFFFGYNIFFLVILGLLLVSVFSGGRFTTLSEFLAQFSPIKILLLSLGALTAPLSMAFAIQRKLYDAPGKLGQLLFLFEIPLVFTCFIFAGVIQNYSNSGLVLIVAGILAPFVLYISVTKIELPLFALQLHLLASQTIALIGSYILFLFSFYVPVIIGAVMKLFFSNLFVSAGTSGMYTYGRSIQPPPIQIIDVLLKFSLGFIALLVVLTALIIPFGFVYRILLSTLESRQSLIIRWNTQQTSRLQAIGVILIVLLTIGLSFPDSGERRLIQLGSITTLKTYQQREKAVSVLLPHESSLKKSLQSRLNTTGLRLFSDDSQDLAQAYSEIFRVSQGVANIIQRVFLLAAFPIVQPHEMSTSSLETNFRYVFGYSAYYDQPDEFNQNTRRPVLLANRTIRAQSNPQSAVATVSIDEEFENTINIQHEIVYEFALPEGSVISDLKLGPDLEFQGTVAPRGAAQRVYEQQLQQRRDPALLEQIGPNSYRLRVFPIPAKNDLNTLKGRRQRVQYSYIVPVGEKGIALPDYTKLTNIIITNNTLIRYVNGTTAINLTEKDTFIRPTSFISNTSCNSAGGIVDLMYSDSFKARIIPYSLNAQAKAIACGGPDSSFRSISGKSIAIITDTSAGVDSRTIMDDVRNALTQNPSFLENNTIDFYKINDLVSPPVRLTKQTISELTNMVPFGNGNVLKSLEEIRSGYQVIFIITNAKMLTFQNTTYPFDRDSHVYFIHPSVWPSYPMELTNKILQSGGSSARTFSEAVRLYALTQTHPEQLPVLSVGTYGTIEFSGLSPSVDAGNSLQLPKPVTSAQIPELAQIANSQLIRLAIRRHPKDFTGNVALMDETNTFASEAKIVTNFSSYIALVNRVQEQNLEQFKNDYTRYQESINNPVLQIPMPQPMRVSDLTSPLSLFGVQTIGGSVNMPKPFGGENISGSNGIGIALPPQRSMNLIGLVNNSSGFVGLFIIGNVILCIFGASYMLLRSVRRGKK